MRKLTQLQYEVIFLYSKGFTFKEIDNQRTTASKGVYMQVLTKDKGRVTRAKTSRNINLNNYKTELFIYLDKVKQNNKDYIKSIQWIKEKYTISIGVAKINFRRKYINVSLDKSYKSYGKYKITFLRNHLKEVA